MNKYTVNMTRLVPQSVTITVEAPSEEEARKIAMETPVDDAWEQSGEAVDEAIESFVLETNNEEEA